MHSDAGWKDCSELSAIEARSGPQSARTCFRFPGVNLTRLHGAVDEVVHDGYRSVPRIQARLDAVAR